MSDQERPMNADWPRGFEEHTLAQRRRLAKLPLSERLRWLEEAHEVARKLERRRAEEGDKRRPGG